MSSTSQLTDYSDLYTDLQQRARVATGVTATENQAKRYINIGLQDMHIGHGEKFWWAERDAVLVTHPEYSTGTVAITNGATAVTGTSTAWTTANAYGNNNVQVGSKIVIAGGDEVYEVTAVGGATSLTLGSAYIRDTETEATYRVFEDEYDLHADFLRPIDLRRFSSTVNISLIDRVEFRRKYPRNSVTGRPVEATLVAQEPSGNTVVRRRLRLYRPPNSTVYMLPYNFVTNKLAVASGGTEQVNLSADADEPIVPIQYRHAIVLHALINWYRDKKDDARSQEVSAAWVDLLNRITGDQEIGSPRPQIQPNSRHGRRPWRRTLGGRFQVGTRFDEIR